MDPVRLAIAGAGGRMGQALVEAVLAMPGVVLAAALDVDSSPATGRDAGERFGRATGVNVGSDVHAALRGVDVLIDFTRPEGTLAHVAACAAAGVGAVVGTTGLNDAQKATLAAHAQSVGIVCAANMSVGVVVLLSLVTSMVLTRLDYGSATLAGSPDLLQDKLQSVLNAAARLVCSGRKYDHITPLLRELHWLPFPERITFRLAVLAYRCQHGLAPSYLANTIQREADDDSRCGLRSASTDKLKVPATKRKTIGDRSFPVTAARAWNSLPPEVTSAPSLPTFKQRLKTELFRSARRFRSK